jgi:hypothetical protein
MRKRLRHGGRRASRSRRHDCLVMVQASGLPLEEHVVCFKWKSGRRIIERCLPRQIAERVIDIGNASGRREFGWFRTTSWRKK